MGKTITKKGGVLLLWCETSDFELTNLVVLNSEISTHPVHTSIPLTCKFSTSGRHRINKINQIQMINNYLLYIGVSFIIIIIRY